MVQIFMSGEAFASIDVNGRRLFCLSIETLCEAVEISKHRPVVIVALEAGVTLDAIVTLLNGEMKHILPLEEVAEQEA